MSESVGLVSQSNDGNLCRSGQRQDAPLVLKQHSRVGRELLHGEHKRCDLSELLVEV